MPAAIPLATMIFTVCHIIGTTPYTDSSCLKYFYDCADFIADGPVENIRNKHFCEAITISLDCLANEREVKPPANFLEEVRALERCHKKQEPAFDEHNLLYRNKRLLIRFKAICSIPSSYLLGMRGCPSRTVIYCLAERENPYCTSSDCRKLNLTQVSGVSSEGGVVTEVVKYGALKKGGDSKESMEKSDEFYASEGIAYEEDFAYYSDETDLAVSNQISLLCFLTTVMMI